MFTYQYSFERIAHAEQKLFVRIGMAAQQRMIPHSDLKVHRRAGALTIIRPSSPRILYNRIIDVSDKSDMTSDLDSAICEMDRESPLGACVEIRSTDLRLAALLRINGFKPLGETMIKLVHDGETVDMSVEAGLPVRRLETQEDLQQAFDLCFEVLGLPVDIGSDPAVQAFGAFHDRTLVSAAYVSFFDKDAYFGPAVTRNGYRGRGLQSALIAARIKAAARVGATLLTADTVMAGVGSNNSSTNNFRRLGFRLAYEKVAYRRPRT